MTATHYPWASALAACENAADIRDLWNRALADLPTFVDNLAKQGLDLSPADVRLRMANDWEVRKREISLADTTGPTATAVITSGQKLAAIDDQSFQATIDYGEAVTAFANAHGLLKKERAKAFMRFKAEAVLAGESLTDGMANMMADADETVAQLLFDSELADAKAKANKAMLEHLDRSFNYHRSVYSREGRQDGIR